MLHDYILWSIGLGFIVAIAVFVKQARQIKVAKDYLFAAKREAEEIAQFPLKNPYPLIQLSRTKDILFVNPAAIKIFGNRGFIEASHPVLDGIESYFDGQNYNSREIKYKGKIYEQSILKGKVKRQDALLLYFYDITARKKFENDLKSSKEKEHLARIDAEKAKEARGEFLANMSHELRTPMNGIIGLSDILVDVKLEGENQDLIAAVNSSAKSLLILLNDILDFSKIEAGELRLENIPFDIRQCVNQIENLQKTVASQKGLILESHVAETVPIALIGDPSRLQQILNNLISNAIKFTEEGAVTINVDGKVESNKCILKIAVQDTGIGIPKNKQAQIFEKFQQADASTARKYGGTGLGLSITKDLTHLMGGTLFIESEEGAGTTFTVQVELPVAKKGAIETPTLKQSSTLTFDKDYRFLVVDDHPINLLFMRKSLSKLGVQNFDDAAGGKQALQLAQTHHYDLIFMDCQMPEMDGFTAARHIREFQKDRKSIIVAVTADAMKGAEEKCKVAGMDDYISKPVDREKLKSILLKYVPAQEGRASSLPEIQKDDTPKQNLFDWDRFAMFTDGDQKTEKMLIDMFFENTAIDIQRMENAFNISDYKKWDEVVHKIAGMASNLGATGLADICDRAQKLEDGAEGQIPSMHEGVLKEYRAVESLLKDYLSTTHTQA